MKKLTLVYLVLFFFVSMFASQQPNIQQSTAFAQVITTPTIYCVGGAGVPPCQAFPSTSTQPSGGVNPSTGTTTQSPSTQPSSGPVTTVDPCATGNTSAFNNGGKHHHKWNRGGGGGFFEQFFKFLIQLIQQLLGGSGAPIPGNPSPSTAPQPSTSPSTAPEPTTAPCPGTSTQPSVAPSTAPSVAPSTAPSTAPTVAPTAPAAGSGTTKNVEITFYGAYDNDPKGSLDISDPVIHQQAGGTGTYADPLTFASPDGTGSYAVGAIIYVPIVQKYFIKEDTCAVSWTAPDGCGAVSHVDLYVGNPSDSQTVLNCEDSLTPGGNAPIIVDPPATLTVDPMPIWNQSSGTCMSPH